LETSSVKALIAYKKGLTVASFLHAHHLKQKEKIETITNLVDNQVMLGDMHTHQQSQGPANGILQFISEYRSIDRARLFIPGTKDQVRVLEPHNHKYEAPTTGARARDRFWLLVLHPSTIQVVPSYIRMATG